MPLLETSERLERDKIHRDKRENRETSDIASKHRERQRGYRELFRHIDD